jgi:hypothetical protein
VSRLRYAGLTGSIGTGNLTSSATSHTFTAALTYAHGVTVPTLAGSDYFLLTILDSTGALSEIVQVTAYNSSTGTATIVRGQEGTSGVAHTSGDKVTNAAYPSDFPDPNLDDSAVAPVASNDQTGTTYTFVLADGRRLVTGSNASAQTYTVPPNSSVAYPLGTVLSIAAKGAGQITLTPGSGVTLNSAHGLKTSAQWAVVSLTKILTDTWVVSGDTTT